MRHLRIIFAFVLFSACSERIDDTHDPVTKTEYILQAIMDGQVRKVQNEYLGIENHPQNREIISEMADRIRAGFDKFGFPDHSQIHVHGRSRWPVAKEYCSEFNGNIVPVVSTDTQLGTSDDLVIHMQFAIVNNQARLLNMSITDKK